VGNIGNDPAFADADGADDIYGTEDDDLHLQPWSPCINAGTDYVTDLPSEDIEGNPRSRYCRVDMGAYESSYPPTFSDCNTNGWPDECDVHGGWSNDCNTNHAPDECEALQVVNASSLAAHGGAGEFALELGLCPDYNRIEPRMPGVEELVCQMNVSLDPATAISENVQVACVNNVYVGDIGVSLDQGECCGDSRLAVAFTPALPDEDCCRITFDGMASIYGQPSVAALTVRTLVGDADRDGSVTTADGSVITQRLGGSATEGDSQYDVDVDGAITTADGSAVTQRLGNVAPNCP
jgi:hypothetical protein